MIVMPAWVLEEKEGVYFARLGSEPRLDSKIESIPKECVVSCVYAPEHVSLHRPGRMALFVLDEEKIPESIRRIIN